MPDNQTNGSSPSDQPVDWDALVCSPMAPSAAKIRAVTYYRRFPTASGAVEVACSDGERYVLKGIRNDAQVGQMVFNDQVAARLGALIGAPVPEVTVVELPQDLIDLNPGMSHLVAGLAHASGCIPDVSDRIDNIDHTNESENRSRFAALAVFFGWLSAGDRQFLYRLSTPRLVYSVDHGHFFAGGPAWTAPSLQSAPPAAVAADLVSACHLTHDELVPAIAALAAITAGQVGEVLSNPPIAWGVDNSSRSALAAYLWKRRSELIA